MAIIRVTRHPRAALASAVVLSAAVALSAASLAGGAPPVSAASSPAIAGYGAAGTFGQLGSTVPSGQSLSKHGISGWGFASGKSAYLTTVSSDGTVFMANESELEDSGIPQTATTTAVSTFSPSSAAFAAIQIATSTGKLSVGTASNPMGADIGDVAPLNGGSAIAFDSPVPFYNGMTSADGQWPSFGIISKGSSGWHVASGSGWQNQWTADQLYNTNKSVGDTACPLDTFTGLHSCQGMNEMRQFPKSHDILVTQYFPAGSNHSGQFMVLHVTGPNSSGKYTVSIAADQVFPNIPDPANPGSFLTVSPRTVRVDPTSSLGNERFVVIFDVFHSDGSPAPGVLEEFSYDSQTAAIKPESAPILAGDVEGGSFEGFGVALIDNAGNLWITRGSGFTGGNLAIYPDVSGTRTLVTNCPDPGSSWSALGGYTSSSSQAPTEWGESCQPYYDLVQAAGLGAAFGLVQDPASEAVVMISQHGYLMPVQPTGTGTSMTFTAGNVVDIGRDLLPLPAPPATGSFAHSNRPGAFDSGGLLWFPVQTLGIKTSTGYPPDQVLDQWLFSVQLSRLFTPDTAQLSGTSGQATVIPADTTATTATTQAAGSSAHTDVAPVAFVGTTSDPASPGGFSLQAASGFGVPTGTVVSYHISVPTAGTYQVAYRAFAFCNTTGDITFSEGSTHVTTPINTTTSGCDIGENGTVSDPTPISLPAGSVTVTLTAQTGGYYLKWFSLTRQ